MALEGQFLWLHSGIWASLLVQQWNASSGSLPCPRPQDPQESDSSSPVQTLSVSHYGIWLMFSVSSHLLCKVKFVREEDLLWRALMWSSDFGGISTCLLWFCHWTAKSFAKCVTSSTQKECFYTSIYNLFIQPPFLTGITIYLKMGKYDELGVVWRTGVALKLVAFPGLIL